MPDEEKRVLTVDEAAEVLRVKPRAVYAAVREGRLRGLRMGRLIRIPSDALEEFLRGEKREERPGAP